MERREATMTHQSQVTIPRHVCRLRQRIRHIRFEKKIPSDEVASLPRKILPFPPTRRVKYFSAQVQREEKNDDNDEIMSALVIITSL